METVDELEPMLMRLNLTAFNDPLAAPLDQADRSENNLFAIAGR